MNKTLLLVIGIVVFLVCLIILIIWITDNGDGPQTPTETTTSKIAVLISTEFAESGATIYDADAWYDTVHTYCMLRANGFTDENIWVLYGYGDDGFRDSSVG